MAEKKATDLLLEMDNKIDSILNYIKNIDLNIKLVSNKLAAPFNAEIAGIKSKSQAIKPSIIEEPEVIFTEVDTNFEKEQTRKVTVHQKILYPNDKPAVLANVKIFTNPAKKEIKATKTNHSGKWNAVLDPGSYFVHITKAEVADKPKIDHYFEIDIPASKMPIELESKKWVR